MDCNANISTTYAISLQVEKKKKTDFTGNQVNFLTSSLTVKTSGPPSSNVLPMLKPSSLMAAMTAAATSTTSTGCNLPYALKFSTIS